MRFYGREDALLPFRINNVRKLNRKIHLKKYKERDCIVISRPGSPASTYISHPDSRYAINLRSSNNQVSRSIFINYIILILSTGEAITGYVSIKRLNRARASSEDEYPSRRVDMINHRIRIEESGSRKEQRNRKKE